MKIKSPIKHSHLVACAFSLLANSVYAEIISTSSLRTATENTSLVTRSNAVVGEKSANAINEQKQTNDYTISNAVAPTTAIIDHQQQPFQNQQTVAKKLGPYQLSNKPAFYQCFHASAIKYNIPVDLLIAIAQTESSMRSHVVGDNGSSQDYGLMQINSSWLPKLGRQFGLKKHHLYEPCTNIDIGAWVLAHNFVEFGYTWNAVGAYNARKSLDKRLIYVRKVSKNLEKLRRGEL